MHVGGKSLEGLHCNHQLIFMYLYFCNPGLRKFAIYGDDGQMLIPVDAKKSYETKAGDVLGLHIRVPPSPKRS